MRAAEFDKLLLGKLRKPVAHGSFDNVGRFSLLIPTYVLTYVNRAYNFDQLTAVKSRYLLTSITWPYRGLTCGGHRGHVFL